MNERMLKQLIEQTKRTNELLALLSEQLELAFLQQVVTDTNPDPIRLHERDECRSKVFDMRCKVGLEE